MGVNRNPFAALEPISQGLMAIVDGLSALSPAGAWPCAWTYGTQYLSDHFQNQLKHWGISPSFAFIEQPQTNGVAERFIRTLKEQVIHGRVFQNLQEVREAVRGFVEPTTREWLVEKNGFKSPWQVKAQWFTQNSIARAA